MDTFISHTTIDCRNAYQLSEWWKGVLGYIDVAGDPNQPGDEECMILDPGSRARLLFIEVPDANLPAKRIISMFARATGCGTRRWPGCGEYGPAEMADHRAVHG